MDWSESVSLSDHELTPPPPGLMIGGTKFFFLSAADGVLRGKKGTQVRPPLLLLLQSTCLTCKVFEVSILFIVGGEI